VTWPLRMIEVERRVEANPCDCGAGEPHDVTSVMYVDRATGARPRVGDCFLAPWFLDRVEDGGAVPESFAPHYLARPEPRRAPIVVVCPGPRWFCIDQRAYDLANHQGWYGDGWNVAGEAPSLTITPSINLVGTYHGYIESGILKADCDGRVFDENGHRIARAAA
jgi:hypothetical protein